MPLFLQILTPCSSLSEAAAVLRALAMQDGYLGGRVLPAGRGKPVRVQVFFPDSPEVPEAQLPDGVRRVYLTPMLRDALLTRVG